MKKWKAKKNLGFLWQAFKPGLCAEHKQKKSLPYQNTPLIITASIITDNE